MTKDEIKSTPQPQPCRFHSFQSRLVRRGILNKRTYRSSSSTSQPSTKPLVGPERLTNVISKSSVKDNAHIAIGKHEEACAIVESILSDNPCDYYLLPFKDYTTSNKRRSDVYDHYHVLCAKNTKISAGWLVCNYVLSAACLLEEGVKRFCTASRTSQLRRHSDVHATKSDCLTIYKCNADEKRLISEAAAVGATLDILPISFCHLKKGFLHIAKALVD